MEKRSIGLVTIITFLLFVTGCAASEDIEKRSETSLQNVEISSTDSTTLVSNAETDFIETQLADGVTVQALVDNPVGTGKVPVYTVDYLRYSPEKAKEVFFANQDIVMQERNGFFVFETPEESLTVGENLSYSRIWDSVLYGQFSSLEKDGEQEDLPFCSLEEAKIEIERTLKRLGVNDFELDRAYSINSKELQREEDSWKDDPQFLDAVEQKNYPYKGVWNPEDGVYIFYYNAVINNISIYGNYYEDENKKEIWGNSIRVTYTNKGIISLNIDGGIEIKEQIDSKNILNVEEVLNKVKEKFDLIIELGNMKITQLKLMYLTVYGEDGGLQLIPMWKVFVEQEKSIDTIMKENGYVQLPQQEQEKMREIIIEKLGDNPTIKSNIYFNALTGREILLQ
ncbi:hypothetical protein LQE92_12445 [Lacrimispora sp. NSJ-141]|uniref:Uncharacterized protein n=1 Tax=Lientehia hominis TaxID=2897778 RepID=A0AAP2RJL4_9FIRM|nr:hypothetical protein [Lientehia hominis]MCD2493424.1 hypothetical protein [Lientehia hominis]